MITDQQFTDWLKDQQAIRCLLVEHACLSSGIETMRYLSSVNYSTEAGDSPEHTRYLSCISGGGGVTESINVEGGGDGALNVGDFEIKNPNGEYDEWLDDIFVNKRLTAYVGDVRWTRSDFRLVFDGIIQDLLPKGKDKLSIKVLDKLQRLNTPVTEQLLGGTSINKDKLVPVLLGECFNITPLLYNSSEQGYQFNGAPSESVIEARANGVPISISENLTLGQFSAVENVYGTVTISAQGRNDFGYENTVGALVNRLAINYGKVESRFSSIDIDADNFSAFEASHQQPVGIYVDDRKNVLSSISFLSNSVGAQAAMSRSAKLRLLKIEFPPPDVSTVISAVDMKADSLFLSKRLAVRSAIKIGYCKNWTIQKDLQTGIPQEHKDYFSTEWVSVTANNAVVAEAYKLESEPVQIDTLLLKQSDAVTESGRLISIYGEPRYVYTFDGEANLVELELGQGATLKYNRYGLSAGVDCIVVKLQINWLDFSVKVSVLV